MVADIKERQEIIFVLLFYGGIILLRQVDSCSLMPLMFGSKTAEISGNFNQV